MQKFIDFMLYNIIVYILYKFIDLLFEWLDLYHSSNTGNMLTSMPTTSDMKYIIVNLVISTVLGYYIYKKVKRMLFERD